MRTLPTGPGGATTMQTAVVGSAVTAQCRLSDDATIRQHLKFRRSTTNAPSLPPISKQA
jgi:hypothetical protein